MESSINLDEESHLEPYSRVHGWLGEKPKYTRVVLLDEDIKTYPSMRCGVINCSDKR